MSESAGGPHIRLLPCAEQGKIDAVKYAFERFDPADIGRRRLAREMEAKGFPSSDGGWNLCSVTRSSRTVPMLA